MVTCPTCNGTGQSIALMKPFKGPCYQEVVPCLGCGASGVISEEAAQDIVRREALRRERMADRLSRDESLREAAARTGMTLVAYSRWERAQDEKP